ncbi:MAG TPA: hypothetical protein VGB91_08800 [Rhizomicrobium sp.]
MISTLQALVESVGEGQFRDRLRARALFFRRGADKARSDGLLDWTALQMPSASSAAIAARAPPT